MAAGFTYTSYQAALVTQIPSLPADPNFQTILPACIDWAEQHISRDLDLQAQHGRMPLGTLLQGANSLPLDPLVVVLEYAYTAAGGMLLPVSIPVMFTCYQVAAFGPPKVWCPLPDTPLGGDFAQAILIGPPANQNYDILGHGTSRPQPLSTSNPTTFISTQLPDLFWAASMIFMAGYNQNYGAMADNTGQAIAWQQQYDAMIKSAAVEEARKQFQSQGWTAQAPALAATPPRK